MTLKNLGHPSFSSGFASPSLTHTSWYVSGVHSPSMLMLGGQQFLDWICKSGNAQSLGATTCNCNAHAQSGVICLRAQVRSNLPNVVGWCRVSSLKPKKGAHVAPETEGEGLVTLKPTKPSKSKTLKSFPKL
jgi:hypothetical protein